MLSPRVPELRSLELLLAVDRAGSIGAAATEFGISQQAVSARIRRTEALVGTPLVNRDAHGSTLTDDGRLVAQWARQIIASAQQLDIGISALRSDHQAHLRVAASMTVAEYLLPGWLVEFYAQRQTEHRSVINVEMTATNTDGAQRMVTHGEAELGFVEGPGVPAKLGHREVAEDELFVVATPDHPWARRPGRQVSIRELTRTALVLREAGSGCRQVLTAQLTKAQPAGTRIGIAEPALELPSNAAVRAASIAGAGPAVLTSYAVADDITAGRLVRLSVPTLDLRRHLHAVWAGPVPRPSGPARDLLTSIVSAHTRRN
ncbi:MAG TPA: LysR family transcriptional regulator [Pseudonocardiaceae bacterium]|jgi:molybdate transport repressor ModE-like protein|nr:LysR family transcriptional regulator [Pseudonocardiaceae bacterium]